jgi:hypothetical protein
VIYNIKSFYYENKEFIFLINIFKYYLKFMFFSIKYKYSVTKLLYRNQILHINIFISHNLFLI